MSAGALSALVILPLLHKKNNRIGIPRVNLWREKVYDEGRNDGRLQWWTGQAALHLR